MVGIYGGQEMRKSALLRRPGLDRETLMREFAPLMQVSIDQIKSKARLPIDAEDLLAAAVTGLLEALKHYDPTVDRNFRSFAELRIRKAMLDEVRHIAEFYQHIRPQPVGPAEATRHMPQVTYGFDWKGHKIH
jgi:DNA-directed RNA polymerase specialized sigma subunit